MDMLIQDVHPITRPAEPKLIRVKYQAARMFNLKVKHALKKNTIKSDEMLTRFKTR